MRKLSTLLSLCLCIAFSASAQLTTVTSCQTGTNTLPNGSYTTPGFSPSDGVFPCITRGTGIHDTLYFTNWDSISDGQGTNLLMTSLTFDSIYLPSGLCWSTNSATNTFTTNQKGVIYISGTTNDSAGQYQPRVVVSANLSNGLIALNNTNAAELFGGLIYRIRVIDAGSNCPTIDNSQADSALVYEPFSTGSSFSAGPDQGLCQNSGTTLAARGTGTWTTLPGNPSALSFGNTSSATSSVSGFSAVGIYGLIWSDGAQSDTMQVIVAACSGGGALTLSSCQNATNSLVPGHYTTPGFSPSDSVFPCITRGASIHDTLYFTCYDTLVFSGIQLTADSITIDSLYLPSGLCWSTNNPTNTFLPGQTGAIYITGTTTDSAGQYKVRTIISAVTNLISLADISAEQYGELVYRVRVIDAGSNCATIDNSQADSALVYVPFGTVTHTFSAGPDQNICQNATATLAATGTGTWTALSGNPAAVSFSNASAANATVTGLTTIGTYLLVYSGGGLSDTVSITVATCAGGTTTVVSCDGGANGIATLAFAGPGFSPTDSLFPCIQAGVSIHDTLYFTNYDSLTFSGLPVTMDSLVIDSVYLPSGICWSTNKPGNYFGPGESGVIYLTGSTSDAAGQYKLRIIVTAVVSTTGSPLRLTDVDAEDAGLIYRVRVVCPGSSCPAIDNSQADSAQVYIPYTACAADTLVWPGDADHNGVVDNNDLLPIGLGYDSTGPARAAQGIVWQGDAATDWLYVFGGYAVPVNFDNADCNGDGTINSADTLAISQNFSLTHAKSSNLPGPWRSGTPGFYLSYSQDTLVDGATITTTISLGNSATPASNIYGLAFTFNYDQLVLDTNSLSFNFGSSWLGNSTNSISLSKNAGAAGAVKVAITGIDHQVRSGSGQIATFTATVTTAGLTGNSLSYYQNTSYISGITAVDASGNTTPLNGAADTAYVTYIPAGIRALSQTAKVNIYPNPASTQIQVTSGAAISAVAISDILGKEVLTEVSNGKLSETIDISALEAGVYIVHASTRSGIATAKLVVSR